MNSQNQEKRKERTKNDLMNNNSWMMQAKTLKEWKEKEEKFMKSR